MPEAPPSIVALGESDESAIAPAVLPGVSESSLADQPESFTAVSEDSR